MMNFRTTANGRADYVRKKKLFHAMGDHCILQIRKVPLYPELISLGDNVRIASGVTFVTHDVIHGLLNRQYPERRYREKIGCIEIGDNVFIGANAMILYNVRIGSNVIVAAGSVVTKDIPDGTICAGVPARRIGSFADYVERLPYDAPGTAPPDKTRQFEDAWSAFYDERD